MTYKKPKRSFLWAFNCAAKSIRAMVRMLMTGIRGYNEEDEDTN